MSEEKDTRILAVDWGSKNIGLAISDPTRTIAKPLQKINHISREQDAVRILEIARNNNVGLILVGVTYFEEGNPSHSGRSALRLLKVLSEMDSIPVISWNEEGSTKAAKEKSIMVGSSKKSRRGHLDAQAAAFILDDYLRSETNT